MISVNCGKGSSLLYRYYSEASTHFRGHHGVVRTVFHKQNHGGQKVQIGFDEKLKLIQYNDFSKGFSFSFIHWFKYL